jgi:SM-20-related protein
MAAPPRHALLCSGSFLSDAEVAHLGQGGVVVRDGLLGSARALACAEAARQLDLEGRLEPARMGRLRRLVPDVRGDRHAWFGELDLPPALQGLWAAFDALRVALNREAWLGLQRFELQLACYPGGGSVYAAHRDALRESAARRVTAIYYLNPGWVPANGGALRVEEPDGHRFVEPLLDRLVLFLSDRVVHEVLPVSAPRFAATAWFRGAEPIPMLADLPRGAG